MTEMLNARLAPTGEADSCPRAIVHRLDRGTTGVLVVAKTTAAEVRPNDSVCHDPCCIIH